MGGDRTGIEILGSDGLVEIVLQGSLLTEVLDVTTIILETASSTGIEVVLTRELGEAPLFGNNDLLATSKLEFCTTKGLDDNGLVCILGTDREDDLTNVDTGSCTHGFSIGSTHSCLKTISTCAGQHLVDTENMEGVKADTHVERVLAGMFRDVFVGADSTGFKSFGRDLLLLVAEQVNAEREFVNVGLLAAKVVDADLGIRDTAAEARLWISLVLLVSVAASRTATHCVKDRAVVQGR